MRTQKSLSKWKECRFISAHCPKMVENPEQDVMEASDLVSAILCVDWKQFRLADEEVTLSEDFGPPS